MYNRNEKRNSVKEFNDIEEIIDIADTNNDQIKNITPGKIQKPSFFNNNPSPSKEIKKSPSSVINRPNQHNSQPIQKMNNYDEKLVNAKSGGVNNLNFIFNTFSKSSLINQGSNNFGNLNLKKEINLANNNMNINSNNSPNIKKEDLVFSKNGVGNKERKLSPYRFNALFNKANNEKTNSNVLNIQNVQNINIKPISKLEHYNNNNNNISNNTQIIRASSVKDYSYKEEKNPKYRNTMEDFGYIVDNFMNEKNNMGFFSLYDGHGGVDSVNYVKDRMPNVLSEIIEKNQNNSMEENLIKAFNKVDNELKFTDSENTGCTACVILITSESNKRIIYSANVGDSKSFLVSSDKVEKLSYDHKCSDIPEVERIKKQGGLVFNGRVFGQLVLTRALGDHALKQYGVISTPFVTRTELNEKHKYVVIASDGIWDVIDESSLVEMSLTISSTEEFAKLLIKTALNSKSKDNISCIVILL